MFWALSFYRTTKLNRLIFEYVSVSFIAYIVLSPWYVKGCAKKEKNEHFYK